METLVRHLSWLIYLGQIFVANLTLSPRFSGHLNSEKQRMHRTFTWACLEIDHNNIHVTDIACLAQPSPLVPGGRSCWQLFPRSLWGMRESVAFWSAAVQGLSRLLLLFFRVLSFQGNPSLSSGAKAMEVQDLGGAQGSLIGLHLLNLQTEQIQGFPFILKQLWLLFSKVQASNSVLCPPPALSPFPVAFTLVFLAVSPSFLSLKAKTASQCMPVKHVGLKLKVFWVLRSPAPPPLFTLPPLHAH